MLANRTDRTDFGVPSKAKAATLRHAGRVCSQPACATILSIYNRSEFCSLHEPRTRKPVLAP